jgi:hypothetical protein
MATLFACTSMGIALEAALQSMLEEDAEAIARRSQPAPTTTTRRRARSDEDDDHDGGRAPLGRTMAAATAAAAGRAEAAHEAPRCSLDERQRAAVRGAFEAAMREALEAGANKRRAAPAHANPTTAIPAARLALSHWPDQQTITGDDGQPQQLQFPLYRCVDGRWTIVLRRPVVEVRASAQHVLPLLQHAPGVTVREVNTAAEATVPLDYLVVEVLDLTAAHIKRKQPKSERKRAAPDGA